MPTTPKTHKEVVDMIKKQLQKGESEIRKLLESNHQSGSSQNIEELNLSRSKLRGWLKSTTGDRNTIHNIEIYNRYCF